MKLFSTINILLFSISLFSCKNNLIKSYDSNSTVKNTGYVAGIFAMKSGAMGNVISIELKNLGTNKTFRIPFKEGHMGIGYFEIPPGKYIIIPSLFFKISLSTAKKDFKFPENLIFMNQPFEIKSNQATYIGNFVGEKLINFQGNYVIHTVRLTNIDYNPIPFKSFMGILFPSNNEISMISAFTIK